MIELFTIIKEMNAYRIQLSAKNIPFYRSDKIMSLIHFLQDNSSSFTIEKILCTYKKHNKKDVEYIDCFELDIYTNNDMYEFIFNNYKSVLERYDKRNIYIPYKR